MMTPEFSIILEEMYSGFDIWSTAELIRYVQDKIGPLIHLFSRSLLSTHFAPAPGNECEPESVVVPALPDPA